MQKKLREAAFTTSWLWDHLHIEVGNVDECDTFHAIGDVDVTCISRSSREFELAQAASAARRILNWLVNGDNGLNSVIQPSGIFLSDHEFTNDDIEAFANLWASKATAFMMTRKQLRAFMAATPSLIKRPSEGEPTKPTLLGRHVIVNDWINHEAQDVWGLNLSPNGLHLWETEDGIRKEPGTHRVLWDVGFGYKLSADVTCMRRIRT